MRTIYTVGHSNGSFESFLELLRLHAIDVVADVRSSPYSKYAVHFSMEPIKASLMAVGIKYVYMGKQLGGMPKDPSLYDEDGHLRYEVVAASEHFQQGIARLLTGVENYNIALMCGEENPAGCHRRMLIAPVLQQHGINVMHIRKDGTLHDEQQLSGAVKDDHEDVPQQLSLF